MARIGTLISLPHTTKSTTAARAGIMVVVALLVCTLASCGSDNNSGTTDDPTTQQWYQTTSAENRKYPIDGTIITPRHITTEVGQSSILIITVCGAEASACGNRAGQAPSTAAPTTKTEPVQVGARIKARLTSSAQCDITLTSSEVQPVLTPTDVPVWQWQIKPASAGTMTLTVHLTPLLADTDQPLLPDHSTDISVDVQQTASNVFTSIGSNTKDVLITIGAVLSACGLTGVGLWQLISRRAKRRSPNPANRLGPRRRRPGNSVRK
jgi:hypothetical protein